MRKISPRKSLASVIALLCFQCVAQAQIPQNAELFQKYFDLDVGRYSTTFTVPAGKRLVITNASARGMYERETFCPNNSGCSSAQWVIKEFSASFYLMTVFDGESGTQTLLSSASPPLSQSPTGVPPGQGPTVSHVVVGSQPVLLYADAGSTVSLGVSFMGSNPRGWTKLFISGYYVKQPTTGRGSKSRR